MFVVCLFIRGCSNCAAVYTPQLYQEDSLFICCSSLYTAAAAYKPSLYTSATAACSSRVKQLAATEGTHCTPQFNPFFNRSAAAAAASAAASVVVVSAAASAAAWVFVVVAAAVFAAACAPPVAFAAAAVAAAAAAAAASVGLGGVCGLTAYE